MPLALHPQATKTITKMDTEALPEQKQYLSST